MSKNILNVLVLDDSVDDTLLLKRALLKGPWEIYLKQVENEPSFKHELKNGNWDIVISDYIIPGFGGMEALRIFNQFKLDIPFILISGKITEEMAVEALFEGAQDFVSKDNFARLLPAIQRGIDKVNLLIEKRKVHEDLVQSEYEIRALIENSPVAMLVCEGLSSDCRVDMVNQKFIETFGYTREDIPNVTCWWPLAYPDDMYRAKIESEWKKYAADIMSGHNEDGVEASITCKDGSKRFIRVSLANAGKKNIVTFEDFTARKDGEAKLRKSLIGTVKAMASTVELRDPYTAGHQRRVAYLARAIAEQLGLSQDRIEGLLLASQIHDIGKIKVPSEILTKPSHLSTIEFELVKTHAEAGYQLLKEIDFPWPIATIIRQHHEKLDGSGYPQGLKDGDILVESQILTVADIVESMASHRPYRAALGIDAALEEIIREKGIKLDPLIVDTCCKIFKDGFKFPHEED